MKIDTDLYKLYAEKSVLIEFYFACDVYRWIFFYLKNRFSFFVVFLLFLIYMKKIWYFLHLKIKKKI